MQKSPIIVALDYADENQALSFIDKITPQDCRLKIGNEMFVRYGANFIKRLQDKGFDVFLDLKFNDIPNTVARAVAGVADLGVWMTNVHASGGIKMMEAAKKALLPFGKNAPILLAVTVLTSMQREDLVHVGINLPAEEQAERLAVLSKNCGLDGVVCSAREVQRFRLRLGKEFTLVTPGIRPVGYDADDQKRIMTPQRAKVAGSDYLVIGRPITQSTDPVQALKDINLSLEQ